MLRFSMTLATALVLSSSLLVACGDDSRTGTDTGSMPADTGANDAAPDTMGDATIEDTGTTIDTGTGSTTCGGSDTCDILSGGGCLAGQGCQFLRAPEDEMSSLMCVTAGTVPDGGTCTMPTDCQEGFACVRPDGADEGTCQHYCCPESPTANDACPTGQMCTTRISGSDVGFCSFPDNCDVVAMTGCTGSEACYPGPDGTFQCAMPGDLGDGDPCETFVNECEPGFACNGTECRRLCDVDTGNGCLAEQTCRPITGYDNLGDCQDPA